MTIPTTIPPMPPRPGHLPVDIPALQSFLASIGSVAGPELILSPDRPLFHYTTLDGLLGILKNDDLWLSHSRYLNDEEELTHGLTVVRAVLDEARGKAGAPLAYLQRVDTILGLQIPQAVYVCCFCARNDLLSQWRAYGENGTGVSVEIDPQGFGPVAGLDCPNGLMRLWNVIYKADIQRRIIQSALDAYATSQPNDVETNAQRAADAIEFFVPTFKNASFSEEQEWRLIFTPNLNCPVRHSFRLGRRLLVPFYTLREASGYVPPPKLLPIRSVMVGPGVNKGLNVESMRLLLAEVGYPSAPVGASETPYRG